MSELTVLEFMNIVSDTGRRKERDTQEKMDALIKNIKPVSDVDAIECIAIIMKGWSLGILEDIRFAHPLFLELYEKTKITMVWSHRDVRIDESMDGAHEAMGDSWEKRSRQWAIWAKEAAVRNNETN